MVHQSIQIEVISHSPLPPHTHTTYSCSSFPRFSSPVRRKEREIERLWNSVFSRPHPIYVPTQQNCVRWLVVGRTKEPVTTKMHDNWMSLSLSSWANRPIIFLTRPAACRAQCPQGASVGPNPCWQGHPVSEVWQSCQRSLLLGESPGHWRDPRQTQCRYWQGNKDRFSPHWRERR